MLSVKLYYLTNIIIYLLQFYLLSVVHREGHHEDGDWPYVVASNSITKEMINDPQERWVGSHSFSIVCVLWHNTKCCRCQGE